MAFLVHTRNFFSNLLLRWYWPITLLATVLLWLGLCFSIWPLRNADGTFGTHPYGLSTSIENKTLDLLFQLRDVRQPDRRTRGLNEPIVLIVIDEASIRASNVRLQKWPRDWYATLIDRASKAGAAVIGLDLLLSEEGGTHQDDKLADQKLVEALANAGNVVLAAKLPAGGYQAVNPLPMFSQAAYSVGFTDLPLDSDGFVRSVPLTISLPNEETQYSFATRLAEGYLASQATSDQSPPVLRPVSDNVDVLGDRTLPLRTDRYLQLDFRRRSPAFKQVSAGDILFNQQKQIPDDLFRDRIVIIGAANIDAPDLFYTPFYEAFTPARLLDRSLDTDPVRTPGAELSAVATATMLFGKAPVRPAFVWRIAALTLPLIIVALIVFRLPIFSGMAAVLVVALGMLIVSSAVFTKWGVILPLATAWVGIFVLTPLGHGLRLARQRLLTGAAEAERALVMDILSRCVSNSVAEELWHRRDKILSGERQIVTVIFTDIRGFTTIAEKAASEQIVEWLNLYFSRMHAIIEKHCGHINKFIGDGMMIVFGAPASRGDGVEARAAVACGLEMLAEVQALNREWTGTERPQLKIGVGIHTGVATCGVVGAERRLEYTVIGDTVNVASRLETITKDYGIPILISDATAALLDDQYVTYALGEVKVKGKNTNTRILTVSLRPVDEATAPTREKVVLNA